MRVTSRYSDGAYLTLWKGWLHIIHDSTSAVAKHSAFSLFDTYVTLPYGKSLSLKMNCLAYWRGPTSNLFKGICKHISRIPILSLIEPWIPKKF